MKKEKFVYEETFIVRKVSEDGLLKFVQNMYGEDILTYSYSSEAEAIEEIKREEVHGAIILKRIEQKYL